MKEKASDYTVIDEDGSVTDNESWPTADSNRNLEGKGKAKWYEKLPYDKFVEDLPMLRYVRGSKAKFTITTFDEINKACQQLFECNKSFFRFRTQVDLLAHYIGTKILEQIYIVRKGKKKYALSQLLEEQEKQFEIWDQMKTVKELFSSLYEKKIEGFVTEKEFDMHVQRYINTFSSPDDRIKMAQVLDRLEETGESIKARDRVRKNFANKQKAFEKGISAVD
jgi:hypothetical protein